MSRGKTDLKAIRTELGLSQARFAALLGVSPRTVQSSEQGWRQPSDGLEKAALLLLMAHRNGRQLSSHVCWQATDCEGERRDECIAYRSGQGHLCWFLTGTLCQGMRLQTWQQKLQLCRECEFFDRLLSGERPE